MYRSARDQGVSQNDAYDISQARHTCLDCGEIFNEASNLGRWACFRHTGQHNLPGRGTKYGEFRMDCCGMGTTGVDADTLTRTPAGCTRADHRSADAVLHPEFALVLERDMVHYSVPAERRVARLVHPADLDTPVPTLGHPNHRIDQTGCEHTVLPSTLAQEQRNIVEHITVDHPENFYDTYDADVNEFYFRPLMVVQRVAPVVEREMLYASHFADPRLDASIREAAMTCPRV
jgi:hypothetical protein